MRPRPCGQASSVPDRPTKGSSDRRCDLKPKSAEVWEQAPPENDGSLRPGPAAFTWQWKVFRERNARWARHIPTRAFTQISLSDGNAAHAGPGWHGTASGGTPCPGAQRQGPSTRTGASCPRRSWLASLGRAEEDELAPTPPAPVLPLGLPGERDSLSCSAPRAQRPVCEPVPTAVSPGQGSTRPPGGGWPCLEDSLVPGQEGPPALGVPLSHLVCPPNPATQGDLPAPGSLSSLLALGRPEPAMGGKVWTLQGISFSPCPGDGRRNSLWGLVSVTQSR